MSAFEIKGWCPGALTPMQSGDGLIVRIRPRSGRLTAVQADAIASASARYGNGLMDLSSRANIQVRGVSDNSYPDLIAALHTAGLIDETPEKEQRRNIIVSPFATEEDDRIACDLERLLNEADIELPSKFGFVIDGGATRHLAAASGDVRIERATTGDYMVRADGAATGFAVTAATAAHQALALARWFAASAGVENGRGRMAAHLRADVQRPAHLDGPLTPTPLAPKTNPGIAEHGLFAAFAFGTITAEQLHALAKLRAPLRLTPWRMILIEGVTDWPDIPDLITKPDDRLLRIAACTGAPRCPQAFAETRDLARQLADIVPDDATLHVAGCAKGCARREAATLTIVATPSGFDFIVNGNASAKPVERHVARDAVRAGAVAYLKVPDAAHI